MFMLQPKPPKPIRQSSLIPAERLSALVSRSCMHARLSSEECGGLFADPFPWRGLGHAKGKEEVGDLSPPGVHAPGV